MRTIVFWGVDSANDLIELAIDIVFENEHAMKEYFEYLLYEVPNMSKSGKIINNGREYNINNFEDLWNYFVKERYVK